MKNFKRFIAKCATVVLLATLVLPSVLGQLPFSDVKAAPNPAHMFITSNIFAGDFAFGSPPGQEALAADTICQNSAINAGFTGTWQALVSTSTRNAADVVPEGVPIRRLDGVTLADNKDNLLDGDLDDQVLYTELGIPVNMIPGHSWSVWTGSDADGLLASIVTTSPNLKNCQDWTTANGPAEGGITGSAWASNSELWITEPLTAPPSGGTSCAQEYGLYCISSDYTPSCGDGILQQADGETCDDGNNVSDDGCSDSCQAEPGVRMFVTSTAYDGNLGGIDGANTICQSHADGAALGGTWVAVIDDETQNKGSVIPDMAIELVNGTPIASNATQLMQTPIYNPINIDENGNSVSGMFYAWSGYAGGLSTDNHCNNWTSNNAGETAVYGSLSAKDVTWRDIGGLNDCNLMYPLYCIETEPFTCGDLTELGEITCSTQTGCEWFGEQCIEEGSAVIVADEFCASEPEPPCENSACYRIGESTYFWVCPEGMQPTMVFITSTEYLGNLGGISGANAKCDARADAASLDGDWLAIISDSSTDVADSLPNTPYVRLDGQLVAENKADLLDGDIINPISITEFGDSMYEYLTEPFTAWSGTLGDGTYFDPTDPGDSSTCSDWSTGDSGTNGIAGIVEDAALPSWLAGCAVGGDPDAACFPGGALTCDMPTALYCYSANTTAMPGGPGGGGGYCGDGIINQPSEMCDGDDLGSLTCTTLPGAPFTGGTLACLPDCSFDVSSCEGGGPAGGDGQINITLLDAPEGDPLPAPTDVSLILACGDVEMPEGMPDPEAMPGGFFTQTVISEGEFEGSFIGIPTLQNGAEFGGPCYVFLDPIVEGIGLGEAYGYGGGVPGYGFEDWYPYLTNDDFSLPMPPGAKYAQVQIGDPNVEVADLFLSMMPLVPGSLSGTVCIDDDPSGDPDTCGAGDTKLPGVDISLFSMGANDFGSEIGMTTISEYPNGHPAGYYEFAELPGGNYMIEAFGMAPTGQEFVYFNPVIVNGDTIFDIVLSTGNSLDITLIDPEVGSCWTHEPIFYNFWPEIWSFDSMPVMGESESLANVIQGFSNGTYTGHIEVPGCMPVDLDIEFDGDEIVGPIMLSAGVTAVGRVVTDPNDPDNTGVANFSFDMYNEFDPFSPMFGNFVGTVTDGNGDFIISGLSDGNWFVEAYEGATGQFSFIPGQGDLSSGGTVTVADTTPEDNFNDDPEILLVLQADKRVNITVTDGITPITNAMIDIDCGTRYVHLGHSNNVWTFLPPEDTCSFAVFAPMGTYQPKVQDVAILAGTAPQDVILTLDSFNQNTGVYGGRLTSDKTTSFPGAKVNFTGHITAPAASNLNGKTAVLTLPSVIPNGNIQAHTSAGTACTVNSGVVSCPISGIVDSFFDIFAELTVPTDYSENNLSASLNLGTTNIGNVYVSIVKLSVNAPKYVNSDEIFTVYGQAYPNATVKLSAVAEDGTETVMGTTVMEPGSSWYSFQNVSITSGGSSAYKLKVTATAEGIAKSKTVDIEVGGSTPRITGVTMTGPYGAMPTNPNTGYPAGQIFEGAAFVMDVTFSGGMTSVTGSFQGVDYPFTNMGGNDWSVTVPDGWTGFGNVTFDLYGNNGEDIVYGPIAETLVLIDPSGYVYDTVDANRIAGVTATVYQLVAGASHATLGAGTTITSITGPDVNTDGTVSNAEEGTTSGEAVGKIAGCGDGTTLDTSLCTWSTWDANPSGQVNPQSTDSDGKYGWNVPQGWYRVSFQKTGAYSLSYGRDIYVPPAETELNLNLGAYDIAAPTVASVNPASGSASVPTNVNPVITFSEPMQASTINTTNIKLKKGAVDVAITVLYDANNYTATITPIGGNLTGSSAYTIEVGTGVKDDSSNALASTSITSFTTATVTDSTAPISTATPTSTTFVGSQSVTLSATDSSVLCTNCTIYYTTDGTAPTTSSNVYTGAINLTSTKTIKFFAKDAANNSETPVNSETYTLTSAPSTPTGLVETPITSAAGLDWANVTGADNYEVFRSTGGSAFASIASPNSSLYTDYNVTVGTTYSYKVRAVNTVGPSGLSASIDVTPVSAPTGCGNGTCDAGETTSSCPADCGGGGGGGGGSSLSTNSDSNSTTSSTPANISLITGNQTYSRPVDIDDENITVDEEADTSIAQVTGEGTLTIRPNSGSTISLSIPANTTVTSTSNWDGTINPPLIKSTSLVSTAGEEIEGSDDTLMRSEVDMVISVGNNATLTFSNPVTLKVPTDLPDGTIVNIYISNDAEVWSVQGTATVVDGYIIFETDHLSYFAFVDSGEEGAVPTLYEGEGNFTDTVGHWAHAYIEQIANMGIVSGKSTGIFDPDAPITRAEITKIAVNAFEFGTSNVTSKPFNDVDTGAWYAPYIKSAKDNSIVQGYEGNVFSPNGNVNRAEALKILLKSAGFEIDPADTVDYSDTETASWYAKYLAFATNNDIVSGYGDGTFRPGNSITRAEVAKIIIKILDLL